MLPIEFSRISRDGRLTLVLDSAVGVRVPTRYAEVAYDDPERAADALAIREQTTRARIGVVDLQSEAINTRESSLGREIQDWAVQGGFDAVIWTDLASNFRERRKVVFSVDSAVAYVMSLRGQQRDLAFDYIRRAPSEVDTPVRRQLQSSQRDGAGKRGQRRTARSWLRGMLARVWALSCRRRKGL